MTDTAFLGLLASYEAALEAANRSLIIAWTLAEPHRSGQRLPDAVVDAYLHSADRDAAQLAELRAKVAEFRGWFRTH